MERMPISLRLDARTLEMMDRLCEQNDMERTTFMQFAIMGMLDYMAEPDGLLPSPHGGQLAETVERGGRDCG